MTLRKLLSEWGFSSDIEDGEKKTHYVINQLEDAVWELVVSDNDGKPGKVFKGSYEEILKKLASFKPDSNKSFRQTEKI